MTVKVYKDRDTASMAGLSREGRVTIHHAAIPKKRRLAVTAYIKRIADKHPGSRELIGIKYNNQSVCIYVSPNSDPKMLKYFMDKVNYALKLDIENDKVIRK